MQGSEDVMITMDVILGQGPCPCMYVASRASSEISEWSEAKARAAKDLDHCDQGTHVQMPACINERRLSIASEPLIAKVCNDVSRDSWGV